MFHGRHRLLERSNGAGVPCGKGAWTAVKLHADQLSNLGEQHLLRNFLLCPLIIWSTQINAGVAAMARADTVAVLLPGAFLFHSRDDETAGRAVPHPRREHGAGYRLQSRAARRSPRFCWP